MNLNAQDDMVCLQSTDMGTRICLAAEGFGNRHCFLENIADKNIPPELSSCVFVIEQALSVRALQEMITAKQKQQQATTTAESGAGTGGGGGAGGSAAVGSSGGSAAKTAEDGAESGAGGSGGGATGGAASTAGGSSSSGSGRETAATGGSRTLLYGHAVLLRHGYSKMHLACLSSTSSSSDKLAFDVGLQEQNQGSIGITIHFDYEQTFLMKKKYVCIKKKKKIGEACWWTVHPASKQRSEGEKVRVGDEIILVSVATERYLVS